MSDKPEDPPEPAQDRDDKGRFKQTDQNGQKQPKSSDYTKMNSILIKQLKLTDKLADFQLKYSESELFDKLSFMADNTDLKAPTTQKSKLPPNEQVAPISPPAEKFKFPGKVIKDDASGIQISMNIKDLLKKKIEVIKIW